MKVCVVLPFLMLVCENRGENRMCTAHRLTFREHATYVQGAVATSAALKGYN